MSSTTRRAHVFNHGVRAGLLEALGDGTFRFTYDPSYRDKRLSPVSLTLPVRDTPFVAPALFPFFFGLLSEGATRALQHRVHRIDEADVFALLLATGSDTVGSVSVAPVEEEL